MRILWIGKGGGTGALGGDEVYDRKLLQCIDPQHEIIHFVPLPVSRTKKLMNLARGVPLYRATYWSRNNTDNLHNAICSTLPDVAVISWEPFDFLAGQIELPTVLLLHNITSDAVVEVFNKTRIARAYASYVRRFERRLYNLPQISAIIALSVRDARIIKALVPNKRVEIVSPGAPPLAPMPMSVIMPEIFISGTYDWYPKRRDLAAAAVKLLSEKSSEWKVGWDHPPHASVSPLLLGQNVDPSKWLPSLRFGLVPDTFSSGFKLKVTYYIANNCVVLSMSDVGQDYCDLTDHGIFIRRISSFIEIQAIRTELAEMDQLELISRFEKFKLACVAKFKWKESARLLTEVLVTSI